MLTISRNDFLTLLKEFPQDYEIFCLIRDQLQYSNNYSLVKAFCITCQSYQHEFTECPRTHFLPDTYFVMKRANKDGQFQERTPFNRRRTQKHNMFNHFFSSVENLLQCYTKNESFILEQSWLLSDASDYLPDEEEGNDLIQNMLDENAPAVQNFTKSMTSLDDHQHLQGVATESSQMQNSVNSSTHQFNQHQFLLRQRSSASQKKMQQAESQNSFIRQSLGILNQLPKSDLTEKNRKNLRHSTSAYHIKIASPEKTLTQILETQNTVQIPKSLTQINKLDIISENLGVSTLEESVIVGEMQFRSKNKKLNSELHPTPEHKSAVQEGDPQHTFEDEQMLDLIPLQSSKNDSLRMFDNKFEGMDTTIDHTSINKAQEQQPTTKIQIIKLTSQASLGAISTPSNDPAVKRQENIRKVSYNPSQNSISSIDENTVTNQQYQNQPPSVISNGLKSAGTKFNVPSTNLKIGAMAANVLPPRRSSIFMNLPKGITFNPIARRPSVLASDSLNFGHQVEAQQQARRQNQLEQRQSEQFLSANLEPQRNNIRKNSNSEVNPIEKQRKDSIKSSRSQSILSHKLSIVDQLARRQSIMAPFVQQFAAQDSVQSNDHPSHSGRRTISQQPIQHQQSRDSRYSNGQFQLSKDDMVSHLPAGGDTPKKTAGISKRKPKFPVCCESFDGCEDINQHFYAFEAMHGYTIYFPKHNAQKVLNKANKTGSLRHNTKFTIQTNKDKAHTAKQRRVFENQLNSLQGTNARRQNQQIRQTTTSSNTSAVQPPLTQRSIDTASDTLTTRNLLGESRYQQPLVQLQPRKSAPIPQNQQFNGLQALQGKQNQGQNKQFVRHTFISKVDVQGIAELQSIDQSDSSNYQNSSIKND